jgi:hypothetical protein
MNNLFKYTTALLMLVIMNKPLNAQYFDNIYRAADADMLEIRGESHIEHILKGATIILPDGSNQLNVSIIIPCNAIDNRMENDSGASSRGLLFNLKINIDPVQVQEDLTSTKTFFADGFLTLNNLTKTVTVQYIPIASQTEESGNFNVYMSVQFNPADFNLDVPGSNTQFVIKINNAKVNRI